MAASEQIDLAVGCDTAAGGREHNQDRCFVQVLEAAQNLWGFRAALVVADGMGGHEQGDQAAQIALDAAIEVLTARVEDHWEFASAFPSAEPMEVVRGIFLRANERVLRWATERQLAGDAGTTLTLVACTDNEAIVANVGDSRAYLVGPSEVCKLTEDDSWASELVKAGSLSEEEAARSPFRSQLTQAVGVDSGVVPHLVTVPLRPGEVVLACTDGLTEVVDAEAIAEVVRAGGSPADLCRALVALAVAAGTSDNVTVAALSAVSHNEPPPAPSDRFEENVSGPAAEKELTAPTAQTAATRIEVPCSAPPGGSSESRAVAAPRADTELLRERRKRLGTLLIVCVISLLLGLLVGRGVFRRSFTPSAPLTLNPQVSTQQGEKLPLPAKSEPSPGPPETDVVIVRAWVEGNHLVVTSTERVTLDVYPRGKFRDATSRLPSVESGRSDEMRYRLPSASPDSWQGQTVVLRITRLGRGALGLLLTPDGEVFVDNKPYRGVQLSEVRPEHQRARVGFYFPNGAESRAYAIAIVGFPVEK